MIGRARAAVARAASPVYRAVFADPVRSGHVKVAGLDAPPWVLTVVGLVAFAALSASLLLAGRYRQGRLLDLGSGDRGGFLPASAMPVVLVGLGLAWVLILVGGSRSRWPIRVLTLAAFLLINAPISKPPAITLGGELAVRIGPTMTLVAYWSVAGLVAASLVLDRWRPARRTAAFAMPAVIGAAVLAFYGSLLWVFAASERGGVAVYVPGLLNHTVGQVQTVLIPMAMLSALGVIGFAYAAADGVAAPLWSIRRRTAALVLVGIVAVKLWIQLVRHLGDLWASIVERPGSAVFTVVMLGLLVGGLALLRRLPRDPEHAGAVTERLMFTTAILLTAPAFLPMLIVSAQSLLLTQFGWLEGGKALLKFPFSTWLEWGDVLFWTPVLGVGLWLLLLRSDRPAWRELGGGLALVAAWELCWAVLTLLGVFPGFDPVLFDVLVTVLVAAYAVARWRSLGPTDLVFLVGVVVFSWLVGTQGDWIALIASPLGVPIVVVLLVGLVWTLVAGSGFTWYDGRSLRRPSRPLVWIGYLLLSLTLLHWFEVTHGVDVTADAGSRAFVELGIPIAGWLVARRPFSPPRSPSPRRRRPDVAPSEGEPASQGTDGTRPS